MTKQDEADPELIAELERRTEEARRDPSVLIPHEVVMARLREIGRLARQSDPIIREGLKKELEALQKRARRRREVTLGERCR